MMEMENVDACLSVDDQEKLKKLLTVNAVLRIIMDIYFLTKSHYVKY